MRLRHGQRACRHGGTDSGGNGSNGCRGLGVDAEPNCRQDILSFVSAPVEEKTFIKGILTADVAVSSDYTGISPITYYTEDLAA